MQNTTDYLPCESMNANPTLPNNNPLYAKCLSCPDFVTACRGIDITLLSGAEEKRAYHKALKKEYGFLLKDIYPLVKHVIGKSTTDEYFGTGSGDYKWTTVITIHNALLSLVAQKKGVPLCENSCSSLSTEVRNQLAAADLNLAAEKINLANMQAECDDLRRKLADADGAHVTQLADIKASANSELEWLRKDVWFWRLLVFLQLAIIVVLIWFR